MWTHGRGGSDEESGQSTYLSIALFTGSERIASALLSPASASAYAVWLALLVCELREFVLV